MILVTFKCINRFKVLKKYLTHRTHSRNYDYYNYYYCYFYYFDPIILIPYFPNCFFIMRRYYCFKDFMYLFLERGVGKEKEKERNINVWLLLVCLQLGIWPSTRAYALTGNRTGDPLVCRPVLNSLSYPSQGCFSCYCHILNIPLDIVHSFGKFSAIILFLPICLLFQALSWYSLYISM